jgi:hypothetical protein
LGNLRQAQVVQQQAPAITAFRNLFKTSKTPDPGSNLKEIQQFSQIPKKIRKENKCADLLYKENDIILGWNSWTSVKQNTRVSCSMLFTVPSNGGFKIKIREIGKSFHE